MIEVIFTKDTIFELDKEGRHGPNMTRKRILMSIINISGIENMEIDKLLQLQEELGNVHLDDSFELVSIIYN